MTALEWFALATAIATVVGPCAAVCITLWYQSSDRKYQRRLGIFLTLLRWRRHPLSADYVGALNLVSAEFHDERPVMSVYGELKDLLGDAGWSSGNQIAVTSLVERTESKAAELISVIANTVSVKISQIEILRGGYLPRGWHDDEQLTRAMRDELS